MTTKTDTARDQAQAQLDHIVRLIEWLEHASESIGCDDLGCEFATQNGYNTCDEDAITEAIETNALSVEVRSGWETPDAYVNQDADVTPVEFRILLCTGGPAVRIMGELDEHGTPSRAWLEYQDWGTPWTEYANGNLYGDLLNYASQFYFGE